ncbi:MAG: carboxypeptidase regulatory-like domain-containing protein, partial [Acidobacteriales bacterium]|nr:carboxypeptidase regulatory-like domain-containing protein [Terriglobales bacterium]
MKAKLLRFVHLALAIFVASASAYPATAPAGDGLRISGVVINAVSGDPVSGAEVAIGFSQKQDVVASVSTASDGSFEFRGLQAGKYWLVAQGKSFSRQGYQQHDSYFTGVAVGKGLESTDLAFRVTPDASIGGTISDDANDPVADARVLLFHTGVDEGKRSTTLRGQTTTDDDGKYRFSHLEPGTYLIAVSGRPWYAQYVNLAPAKGENRDQRSPLDVAFPVTYFSGTTDGDQASPIQVRGGEKATADLQLTPVPGVHVIVNGADDSKSGISISMVQQIMGTSVPPVGSQVTALPNGQYEVAGIAPGQYTAVVQTYGKGQANHQRQIDLAQDAEINTEDISAGAQISGTVTLDGAPAATGGVVRLMNHDSGDTLQAVIDSKGHFTVNEEMIAAGHYDVAIFNVPDTAVKGMLATGARITGLSVEVARGATVQLSLALIRGLGQVDGVVMRQGKPVAGAMVVLVPQDMDNNIGLLRRDQSDSDGTFTLRNVVPGEYNVLALESGWDMEWRSPGVLSPF